MMNEQCPCKRTKCERHGNCEQCREHHKTVKKNVQVACERQPKKEEKEVKGHEKKRPRNN